MKQFAQLSMLLALSVVLSILESFVPIFSGIIPGLKIGLSNIVILVVLYLYRPKDAITISLLRVFLVGILRTGIFSITFFFSLGGAFLSIIGMIIAKKGIPFTIIGVSLIGSVCHSIGQILIAILVLQNTAILYYLPWLILFSIPTGIGIGFISKELVKQLINRK